MSAPARLFLDVSYTRTQRANVGITRTVRRLEEELRRQCEASAVTCTAVSYHSGGFRQLEQGKLPPPGAEAVMKDDKAGSRLFRLITGAFFRRLVLLSLRLIPWGLLSSIWTATSSWSFNFLSRAERSVAFGPDDVLLLCDASWNYPVWIAARKARRSGAKVVFLLYDLMALRYPQFCFPLVPLVFRHWLARILPIAHCVIGISDATEQDLKQFAREEKLSLCPTGHFRLGSDPVSALRPGAVRPALSAFALRGAPCFAAIGSFEPKKNYGFLLEVFEQLWARGVDVRLLIIGRDTGEFEEMVKPIRSHSQQGGNLMTLFDATDAEVAFAYENCRALVFPSLAEGFGLPMVEARTCGCLVIASSLPVFIELADEGVSIYPEGSHEALQKLIVEHAKFDRRGQIPPMPAFTWAASSKQLLAVIEELLARQKIAA